MEREIQLEAEDSRKKIKAANKLVQKIEKNDNCVSKICKLLGIDQSEEHLKDVSMEDFSKLLNADLESFILVRNKENQVKGKLPKKGKLESAINGRNNNNIYEVESKSAGEFNLPYRDQLLLQ